MTLKESLGWVSEEEGKQAGRDTDTWRKMAEDGDGVKKVQVRMIRSEYWKMVREFEREAADARWHRLYGKKSRSPGEIGMGWEGID